MSARNVDGKKSEQTSESEQFVYKRFEVRCLLETTDGKKSEQTSESEQFV